MNQKAIETINDRILGLQNDLKAFIYIRMNNLQHQQPDDIGGGNFVSALSLFTALSFLGKAYYYIEKPNEFDAKGHTNETDAFTHFYGFIYTHGIDLGLPNDMAVLRLVWHGFRDYLAHLLVAEPGKALITFVFDDVYVGTISEFLESKKTHVVFKDDGTGRNWKVNCDALLARIPDIAKLVTAHIQKTEEVDLDALKNVIGFEY
jgi:hypothetical protein